MPSNNTISSRTKRKRTTGPSPPNADTLPTRENPISQQPSTDPNVELDDLCPICHLLLYKPVTTTQCHHTLCEFCMSTWADMSILNTMTMIGLDSTTEPHFTMLPLDQASSSLSPQEEAEEQCIISETKCPMCRTLTTCRFDHARERTLKQQYPITYATRHEEATSAVSSAQQNESGTIEHLTLYIGNEHKLIRPADPEDGNRHEWKFFVRVATASASTSTSTSYHNRTSAVTENIIEEVHVFLHPTFRNSKLILQHPSVTNSSNGQGSSCSISSYEIIRVGWGSFRIHANVILRAGYSWIGCGDAAEDTEDGGRLGKLCLGWVLDFNGRGSQGRLRVKVKREKSRRRRRRRPRIRGPIEIGNEDDVGDSNGESSEDEDRRERERVRRLWIRQRERDPDYVPPPDIE